MDFDPLNFFTGEDTTLSPSTSPAPPDTTSSLDTTPELPDEFSETDLDGDAVGLIHILDLPPLNALLPRDVLLTILDAVKPDQVTNFGPSSDSHDKSEVEILESREISCERFEYTKSWLMQNGYNRLAGGLLHIHFTQDFFSYLNKVVGSLHFAHDEEVLHSASLRISENCGRTARPNFQRKIVVEGLANPILLNEPAITADSLGLKTWGSSLVLSELLLKEHGQLVLGSVLELGAGTGLVGITLGLLGYDVTLTDLPEILPNLKNNVKSNGLNCECLVLDWANPTGFVQEKGNGIKYTTIVVADPIYSSEHPRWVMNMIIQFLEKSRDARVLLQIPARRLFEKERETLWRMIEEEGLCVKDAKEMDGFDDFGAQKFIFKELRWSAHG